MLPKLFRKTYKKYKTYRIEYFPNQAFSSPNIVLHFSYHKCLTAYYQRIMRRLGGTYYFDYQHFKSDISSFDAKVKSAKRGGAYSVNNHSDIDFAGFPQYKGSHFIRDPRDLIVSGYKYHLRTKEIWAIDSKYDWNKITQHPYFAELVESNTAKWPNNISYQDYLNTLPKDRGIVLEMLWRLGGFKHMGEWDFNNPEIIEFKYEDIIGHEIEVFDQIFDHYGFSTKVKERGLELVDELSLKNMKKQEQSHVRHGGSRQWESELSQEHLKTFDQLYPD